jgi:hypothetical protein
VLRVTSAGLEQHRSLRFIQDEVRADLLGRFETLEHGVLAIAAEHSLVIGHLSKAVLEDLGSLPHDPTQLLTAPGAISEQEEQVGVGPEARLLASSSGGGDRYRR